MNENIECNGCKNECSAWDGWICSDGWLCCGCYESQQPVLNANDVREARLDCNNRGSVFEEIKMALAIQVLRSIATEQVGASATVKALAEETLKRIS